MDDPTKNFILHLLKGGRKQRARGRGRGRFRGGFRGRGAYTLPPAGSYGLQLYESPYPAAFGVPYGYPPLSYGVPTHGGYPQPPLYYGNIDTAPVPASVAKAAAEPKIYYGTIDAANAASVSTSVTAAPVAEPVAEAMVVPLAVTPVETAGPVEAPVAAVAPLVAAPLAASAEGEAYFIL